jgi:uncharacterized protein
VYVDFFGVLTLADVAARIERAYLDGLEGRLASWFRGLRRRLRPGLRVGVDDQVSVGVEVELDPQAEPPLLDRLELPRRIHERDGTRTLVVFDEFQDVLATKERADATIRSEVQHHGDAASYIFAGSQLGMMRKLFADRRRALYGQALPVELPPLPPDEVAEHVDARFHQTRRGLGAALEPLLATAAGHPQRTMLLAHLLWEETPPGAEADDEAWARTYERAMRVVHDEVRAIWTGLSTGQRRALSAIAEGRERLYASGRRYGGSRGGALRAAVQALADRGEITRAASSPTGWSVVDPLLRDWVAGGRFDAG